MALRLALGFSHSETLSFKGWSPLVLNQWKIALADLKSLLRLKLPDHQHHQGLAGLVQAFGLLIFIWMAITGTLLFIIQKDTGSIVFEIIEEAHEIGESLIPLFLGIHIGAVFLHTVTGNPIWKRMFSSN
ncbi:MAG: cytochrome b/b6 domain-containing protein [Gammaproteobacteria bacterium]|nr:cytochrome b/b6 domain-containing protein [Gammaproteobacteria bacterium]